MQPIAETESFVVIASPRSTDKMVIFASLYRRYTRNVLMKHTGLLIIAIIIVNCSNLSAQFTIPAVPPAEETVAPDTVFLRTVGPITNIYFEQGRMRAEKRALRKERNTFELNSALQMSQTQFANWAAGGDNTFSGRTAVFLYHKYQRSKFAIESKFEARYGLSYIEKKRFKNEDEFKLNLLSSYQMSGRWSYAASANLLSQFTTSYKSRDDDTRTATFMAPGYLELALGFKYENKPFTIVFFPVSGNAVFMMDDRLSAQGLNGVKAGRHSEWSVGPSIQANLDTEFVKKVFRLRSSFYTFTNIKKRPIMRWETTVDIRATKFLTTTIYGFVNYDRESNANKPKNLQYKYAFAVGLAYTFKNKQ